MKKYIITALITVFVFAFPVICHSSENVPCVFVDGNFLDRSNDFVNLDGMIYADVQRLSDVFGYTLSSDDDGYVHSFSDNMRTVTYDSYSGSVNIGDRHSFSFEIYENAYVPYSINGKTDASFVPLRMFCEAFEISIEYDSGKNEVYIVRNPMQKGFRNSLGTAITFRNGKYGLVNSDDVLIVNYRYDNINNYDNPLLFKTTDNHRCGLIDSKGKVLIDNVYTEINYVSDDEIYLTDGKLKGMCNIDANMIIPVVYDDIIYCGNKIAMVKTRGKWRLLNCSSNELGSVSYDNVYKVTEGIHTDNGMIKGYYVEKNGKWGYVDSFGNVSVEIKYDALDKFDSNGRARVILNDKFGIVDCGGKTVIPTAYDFIYPFDNLDVTVANVGKKYGVINKNGNPVVSFEYDYIYPFENTQSTICYKDGKFAIVSSDGRFLTDFKYNYAEPFNSGKALVYDGGYGYLDHNGNEIVNCIHSDVTQGSTLSVFLKYNNKWALFSSSGKNLTGYIFETVGAFSNGLSAVGVNINNKTKYGYVNDSGDLIIDYIYDSALDFNYGKAIVSKNGKCGIIDVEGNCVIAFDYSGFNPSYDYNLIAAANSYGKWGVISYNNKTVVDFIYDYVFEFKDGFAVVLKDGKYGAVSDTGEVLLNAEYRSYDDVAKKLGEYHG